MPAVRFNDETETIKAPKTDGDAVDGELPDELMSSSSAFPPSLRLEAHPSSFDLISTDPYFEYYSSLQNQANMLSDTLRTSGYR